MDCDDVEYGVCEVRSFVYMKQKRKVTVSEERQRKDNAEKQALADQIQSGSGPAATPDKMNVLATVFGENTKCAAIHLIADFRHFRGFLQAQRVHVVVPKQKKTRQDFLYPPPAICFFNVAALSSSATMQIRHELRRSITDCGADFTQ